DEGGLEPLDVDAERRAVLELKFRLAGTLAGDRRDHATLARRVERCGAVLLVDQDRRRAGVEALAGAQHAIADEQLRRRDPLRILGAPRALEGEQAADRPPVIEGEHEQRWGRRPGGGIGRLCWTFL